MVVVAQTRVERTPSGPRLQARSTPAPVQTPFCMHRSEEGAEANELRRTGRGMQLAARVVKRKGQLGSRTATASRGSRERSDRAVSRPQRCSTYSVCG
uniref:Uncharacterized protein n=1 Tax=Knipowitschia caucasica TaxID=637954 RepID=A0AAV2KWK1_KNICA